MAHARHLTLVPATTDDEAVETGRGWTAAAVSDVTGVVRGAFARRRLPLTVFDVLEPQRPARHLHAV